MTDTAYLYQYFLENSDAKKDAVPKARKEKTNFVKKEEQRDGKHVKLRA